MTKNSPLIPRRFEGEGTGSTPQDYYNLNRTRFDMVPNTGQVREIIDALDEDHRWVIRNANTSNPYAGPGQNQELTDKYATTNVGDETDTSPYRDDTDQEYISTREYIRNMNLLMNYISQHK